MRAARSKARLTSNRCGKTRQRASSSRRASKFVDGTVEHALRPRSGENQVGRQPGPIAEPAGGDGAGPLDLLDGPLAGRHALADVQQHHPHGVAAAEIGDLEPLPPLRPCQGQGDQQHGQRPQDQQQRIAQAVPASPLANGLADEAQRRERHSAWAGGA